MQIRTGRLLRRAAVAAKAPFRNSTKRTSLRPLAAAVLSHANANIDDSLMPWRLGQHSFHSARAACADGKDDTDTFTFQAETVQLLDIVINSLYTDKDTFIRELVSNASDALEKVRYLQNSGVDVVDKDAPMEIRIMTDEESNTITIEDNGIGLSREQLVENLGTIARSGSKAFLDEMSAADGDASSIIGRFGVGFYSAFMVAKSVKVYSRSATDAMSSVGPGNVWSSDGAGAFEVSPVADGLGRGTRIVIELRDADKNFASATVVESALRKYSNFVPFPIKLNGDVINTVQAIWAQSKSEITDDAYTEFYRYVASAYDEPMYRLHFQTDAPINLQALFFIGSMHEEKYGMGRMQPGVSLYSRKVLIESKMEGLLPDWMRFVKGVIDSADIPLNVSRESMQDSALVKKISNILTRRMIRTLEQEMKNDRAKYDTFFAEFGHFLKEGAVTDFERKNDIAKLLLFETSSRAAGELSALDDYISRCPADQGNIYYLCAPSRELAQASPYFEAFKHHKMEVLFLYTPIDEFVMNNLAEYEGRKLVSAESAGLDLAADGGRKDGGAQEKESEGAEEDSDASHASLKTAAPELDDEATKALSDYLKTVLDEKVSEVTVTSRLVSSPAVLVDHESAAIMRMMRMADQEHKSGGVPFRAQSKHKLEINPAHPILRELDVARNKNPDLAQHVADQLFDNCLMAAGILEDPVAMLPRLNALMRSSLSSTIITDDEKK
eukprot:g4387.t1